MNHSNTLALAVSLLCAAALPPQASAMGMGGGCMMGCGGGTTLIDPPMGAAFADPAVMPNLSTTPGVVEVNLEAKVAAVNVNGATASLQTYNGYYPAPTIKVKKGDQLKVHFLNSLPAAGPNMMGLPSNETNLHTHGLHVSPMGNSDNVMQFSQGGQGFDYQYDLSLQAASTLNWYHPHRHGNAAQQVWAGQAGAIEVADGNTALAGFETHIMVLKDITISSGAPAAHSSDDFMNGKEGDTMMVNGKVNPVLTLRPGQVQRWKIVNASNARFYQLSLAGHTLQVIGVDGGLLDKPYPQSTVLLAPGERVDILVKASTAKTYYKLKALAYNRDAGASASQEITLLTANVTGTALSQAVPAAINAQAARIATPPGAVARSLTMSMGMMMMGGGTATINGIGYSDASAYTVNSLLNSHEVWTIYNQSMMDHPWNIQ